MHECQISTLVLKKAEEFLDYLEAFGKPLAYRGPRFYSVAFSGSLVVPGERVFLNLGVGNIYCPLNFRWARIDAKLSCLLGEPRDGQDVCYELRFDRARIQGELCVCGYGNTLHQLSLQDTRIDGDLLLRELDGDLDLDVRFHVDCRGLKVSGAIHTQDLNNIVFLVDDEKMAQRIHWASPTSSVVYVPTDWEG